MDLVNSNNISESKIKKSYTNQNNDNIYKIMNKKYNNDITYSGESTPIERGSERIIPPLQSSSSTVGPNPFSTPNVISPHQLVSPNQEDEFINDNIDKLLPKKQNVSVDPSPVSSDIEKKAIDFEPTRFTNKRNKIPESLQYPSVHVNKKSVKEYTKPILIQDIETELGSITVMKFSKDGLYLAIAGNRHILLIYKVYEYNIRSQKMFGELPFRVYEGHIATITDLTWSKNHFIVTTSLDNTLKLWHLSKEACVYTFASSDHISCISFHPSDNNYFLSGGTDHVLKIWKLPECEVIHSITTPNIITSAIFSPTGRFCIIGLINGKMIFYTTDNLMYYTEVDCKNHSGTYSDGRPIIGFDFINSELGYDIAVTTNDNRIRIYNIGDYSLKLKCKGHISNGIPGCIDDIYEHIICGSDDGSVYMWRVDNEFQKENVFFTEKKNRNHSFESFKVVLINEKLTACIFCQSRTIKKWKPDLRRCIQIFSKPSKNRVRCTIGSIILVATDKGHLRVYVINKDPIQE